MDVLLFKTKVKCTCQMDALSKCLGKISQVRRWTIDIADPDGLLRIESENVSVLQIKNEMAKHGFNISLLG